MVTALDHASARGTGPGEKYHVADEQGRDLLNSVRAAQQLSETGAGDRFGVYGRSQGGFVALAGASLWNTYATELEPVGAGAVSAASYLGSLLREIWQDPSATWTLGPILVDAWVGSYPELDAAAILTDAGLAHYKDSTANTCILSLMSRVVYLKMGQFVAQNPADDPAWRARLIENQRPPMLEGLPLFVAHVLDDTLVLPPLSTRAITDYCAGGNPVMADWMEGVQHLTAAHEAGPRYVDWIQDRFEGVAPPSNCGDDLPVEPIEPLT